MSNRLPSADPLPGGAHTPSLRHELNAALQPVFAAAEDSSILVTSQTSVDLADELWRIPKFLLRGEQSGGSPLAIGLFAGFESGHVGSASALAQAVLRLLANPELTRGYTLAAYPVVNLRGFGEHPIPLSDFEARYSRGSGWDDVQFFQREFRLSRFDGIISVRTRPEAQGLSAVVRSEVIAAEVVRGSVAAVSAILPLASSAVKVLPQDRYARTADYSHGRLIPPPDLRPQPFDVELLLPSSSTGESRDDWATGLFVVVVEILRRYRELVAHCPHL
jgi:hypothetical protein